jgi:cellulose synthase/poly-beta-1,6-N-acetylglucosamine synthase-like glycosyltransferase
MSLSLLHSKTENDSLRLTTTREESFRRPAPDAARYPGAPGTPSQGISIIIPTLNESGNIRPLSTRIRDALQSRSIPYELIFIDDHSTDSTKGQIEALRPEHPCRVYLKRGAKGKAQSLLEGFARAKYDVLAMIDADLQYPPEAIPTMLEWIRTGYADVVIADRQERKTSRIRDFFSRSFAFLFVRLLHGMPYDVQSGLKVFRREVLDAVIFDRPSPWAFDLDFLVQARDAGYRAAQKPVTFEERQFGDSKVSLLSTSWQIGWSAVKLKLRRRPVARTLPEGERHTGAAFRAAGRQYIHHSGLDVEESAFWRFLPRQGILLGIVLALLLAAYLVSWHATTLAIVCAITVLYFADLGFSLFLIYQAFARASSLHIDHVPGDTDRHWPVYTILCPLYRERQVLPQFATAINRLDYPKHRLEVLLLLEEDDAETLEAARAMTLPPFFKIVIVPHSLPKTKPKACNYGLTKASGDFIVIYDAEDVPESTQLKKAVLAFEQLDPSVVCVQAKLNFYNPNQNLLTRLFTAEYSLWFDLILPGLQACNCPIPLGGTSNHFRTSVLRALGGWDAFNVTEDCDLGVRLAKRGYLTAILDSTTLEEANSSLKNWFPQRTRWIKGYVQTYFVHMREPAAFGQRRWLEPRLWAFQLVVGGKVFSMLVNPLLWALTTAYFVLKAAGSDAAVSIEAFFPGPVLYIGVSCLIFGNFLYTYYYMVACTKRSQDDLIKYVFVVPFYWVAMSVAAWIAVYKFVRQPHYWAKTQHGLHLGSREGLAEAELVVGQLVDEALLGKPPRKAPAAPVVRVPGHGQSGNGRDGAGGAGHAPEPRTAGANGSGNARHVEPASVTPPALYPPDWVAKPSLVCRVDSVESDDGNQAAPEGRVPAPRPDTNWEEKSA